MMRIVSWNMGCWPRTKYRRTHADAWSYLLAELKLDLALVQEAFFSAADIASLSGHVVWSADRGTDSGTAVFIAGGLRYEPCVFRNGMFFGIPEEGLDAGAVYLHGR